MEIKMSREESKKSGFKRDYIWGAALVVMFLVLVNINSGVDSQTGATTKAAGDVVLPKAGDTYKVWGVVPGLQKFVVEYNSNYFRGGMFTGREGMETLKKYGVKTVVSITPDDLERLLAEKFNMNLVEIEFDHDGVPADKMALFLKTLKEKPGPFYVHCHGGTHRANTLSYAYRTIVQGMDPVKARKEFVALGGHIEKDKALLASVDAYAKTMQN